MKSDPWRIVPATILMVCATACALSPQASWQSPIASVSCEAGLEAGFEVSASLVIQGWQKPESFLMALKTGQQGYQITLLSPQGIPAYHVVCEGQAMSVSKRAKVFELTEPKVLLTTLQMIFLDRAQLESFLNAGWSLQEDGDVRTLLPSGKGANDVEAIVITYRGGEPWYEEIVLKGYPSGALQTLRILEKSRVLSQ